MISPCSTAAIPPQPQSPQYLIASTVLTLSLHNTDAIPPHVLMLFPHSTEQPPQYWCYPPQSWTASAVLNRRYMGCWSKMAAKNHEHTYLRLFRGAFSVNPCGALYTAIVQCQYYFLLFRATYLKHFPKHVLGLRFNMYSWPPDFCIRKVSLIISLCHFFVIEEIIQLKTMLPKTGNFLKKYDSMERMKCLADIYKNTLSCFWKLLGIFWGNLLFVMGQKSGKKQKGTIGKIIASFFLALSQYCGILVLYYPNMLKLALVFSVPSYNMVSFSQYGSFWPHNFANSKLWFRGLGEQSVEWINKKKNTSFTGLQIHIRHEQINAANWWCIRRIRKISVLTQVLNLTQVMNIHYFGWPM